MTLALSLVSAIHFAAVMTLFGASLFPLYAGRGPASASAAADRERRRRLLSRAAGLALASGLAWLALIAAVMGDGPADALKPEVLATVLTGTGFGRVWQPHLALALALVAATRVRSPLVVPGLSAALLAGLAWTGHAVMASGAVGALRVASQTVHLFAAALWLGGLVPLGWSLAQARRDPGAVAAAALALRRFSALALAAVILLGLSGLVNGWFLVGSLAGLDSPYGRVLAVKLLLVAAMLGLALRNRLVLMPRLALAALGRAVVAEQLLGLAVLGVASWLGSLAPAVNGP